MAELSITSPGVGRTALQGKLALRELPWCGKINLRGDPQDDAFTTAATTALGGALPLAPNTTLQTEAGLIFWLGRDEWLLHCDVARSGEWMNTLSDALATVHHAATEVTDYYTVLAIGGEAAGPALTRGCPLDLHPSQFPPGRCAQTRFGNASVLLHRPEDEPASYRLQVRWSFCGYVWDYLAEVSAML